MAPVFSPQTNRFSPCSIGNVCGALGRRIVRSDCLVRNGRPEIPINSGSHSRADPHRALIGVLAIWLGSSVLYFAVSGM